MDEILSESLLDAIGPLQFRVRAWEFAALATDLFEGRGRGKPFSPGARCMEAIVVKSVRAMVAIFRVSQ